MSYAKMMKWNSRHRKGIKQMFGGFSDLETNERRRSPRESSAYLDRLFLLPEAERLAKTKERQEKWDIETERLLKINPKLILVD